MKESDDRVLEGGCVCRAIRYRLEVSPIYVHCCHCTWCQRETGSAFALNAMIETDELHLSGETLEAVAIPSAGGKGQTIMRCPHCRIALYSHYAGAGKQVAFVRVGTLDDAGAIAPDIHIYTSTKQPWVVLPRDALVEPGYYDRRKLWPAESLARVAKLKAQARPTND